MEENRPLHSDQGTYHAIVKLFRKQPLNLGLIDLKLKTLTDPNFTDDTGNTLLHQAVEKLQQKSIDRLNDIITSLHQINVRADIKNHAGEIPAALAQDEDIHKRLFTLSYFDNLKHTPKGLALFQKEKPLMEKDNSLLMRTIKDIIHDELSFLSRIKEIIKVAHPGYRESLTTLCIEYNEIYRLLFMVCEPAAIYALSEIDLLHKEEAIINLVETYASTKQVIAEEEASQPDIFKLDDDPMAKADLYSSRMAGFYNELGKRAADIRLIKMYYQHPGILAKAREFTLNLLSPAEKDKLDHAYAERDTYLREFNAQRRFSYHQTLSGNIQFSPIFSQDESNSNSPNDANSPEVIRTTSDPLTIQKSKAIDLPKTKTQKQPELQQVHNHLVLNAVKTGNIELLEILLDDGLNFYEQEKLALDQVIDALTLERIEHEFIKDITQQQITLIQETMDNPKKYISDQNFGHRLALTIEKVLGDLPAKLEIELAKQQTFWFKDEYFLLSNDNERQLCLNALLQQARDISEQHRFVLPEHIKLSESQQSLSSKLANVESKLATYEPISSSATLDIQCQRNEIAGKHKRRQSLEIKLTSSLQKKYDSLISCYSKYSKFYFPKEYHSIFDKREEEKKTLGELYTPAIDQKLLMPILKANVDPNLIDNESGERLLTIAVKQKDLATVEILLKHRADPSCRGEKGDRKSAFTIAMEQHNNKILSGTDKTNAESCLRAITEHNRQRAIDTREVLGMQHIDKFTINNDENIYLFNWIDQNEFEPIKMLLAILSDLKKELDVYGQAYLDRQHLPFFTRFLHGYHRNDLQIHRGKTLAYSYESLWNGIKELDLDGIYRELKDLIDNMKNTENSQLYKAIEKAFFKISKIDRLDFKNKHKHLTDKINGIQYTYMATFQKLTEKEAEVAKYRQENSQLNEKNYQLNRIILEKEHALSNADTIIGDLKILNEQAKEDNIMYKLRLAEKDNIISKKEAENTELMDIQQKLQEVIDEQKKFISDSKIDKMKTQKKMAETEDKHVEAEKKYKEDMEKQKAINQELTIKVTRLEKLIERIFEEQQEEQSSSNNQNPHGERKHSEPENLNNQENSLGENKNPSEAEPTSRLAPKYPGMF